MQETLAHEWRKRMAARSSVIAMLLAIPVLVAALIGFSAGPGGLPFGISSLANGPGEASIGVNVQGRQANAVARALANAATATTTTAAALAGGAGGGAFGGGGSAGGGGGPGGSTGGGGTGGGGGTTLTGGGTGTSSPGSSGGPSPNPSPSVPSTPDPSPATDLLDGAAGQAQDTIQQVVPGGTGANTGSLVGGN